MGQFVRMRDFYKECLRRAWRGKFLVIESISGFMTLVGIPIAAYWEAPQQYMNWLPLAFFLVVFVGTLFIGFITAPYCIARELEQGNEKLQLQIENKEARQNAIDKLWQLRSEGISLRNKEPSYDNLAIRAWVLEIRQWREKVLLEAGKVNVNLKCYLERLDHTCPVPGGIIPFPGDHELHVRIASKILLRLEEYLKKEL